tara:strand:- start:209 stop:421 length:213 start_codon:yes stop_codon:yes gene_type:complete
VEKLQVSPEISAKARGTLPSGPASTPPKTVHFTEISVRKRPKLIVFSIVFFKKNVSAFSSQIKKELNLLK